MGGSDEERRHRSGHSAQAELPKVQSLDRTQHLYRSRGCHHHLHEVHEDVQLRPEEGAMNNAVRLVLCGLVFAWLVMLLFLGGCATTQELKICELETNYLCKELGKPCLIIHKEKCQTFTSGNFCDVSLYADDEDAYRQCLTKYGNQIVQE